jgi:hypothetical protein
VSRPDYRAAGLELARRTCEAQGLPLLVDDPGQLAQVAALLRGSGAGGKEEPPATATTPAGTGSQPAPMVSVQEVSDVAA